MRLLRSRLFLLVVLLIGAGLLWRYCIADWLAERRWQQYAREAKSRGLRWTLAEYRPAAVPEENDAARLPVFASHSTYASLLNQVPVLSKARQRRQDDAPPVVAIDWKETRKHLPGPDLNVDPLEPDNLRALDDAARPLQPMVEQLCASKATAGNWGDDVWQPGPDSTFPHAQPAMQCFRLLQFRANLDLALGRPAEARRVLEAHFRIVRAISKTPTLILHLVTLAGLALAQETVWRGINLGAWDDDTLNSFAAEFRSWNTIADYQWSIETERAWSRGADDKVNIDVEKTMQVLNFMAPQRSWFDEWRLRLAVSRPAWHRNNQLWYERAQDELATMLDAATGTWRPIDRQFEPDKLTQTQRALDLAMAARSMPMMHTFMQKSVWVHAQNQMAAIACALELTRRATGKYPANLQSLIPIHLPRLPIDPATGGPFRYTLQPDGTYLLYSLGFDREDQGGKPGPQTDGSPVTDLDWRWWPPHPPTQNAP